jgi:hypothetical protein
MKAEWDGLLAQWLNGSQTREGALRLLFLSWYSCSEPPHLSGLEGVKPQEGLVDGLFKFLGGEETQDVEVLFVIAVMGEVAAWCLGEDDRWRTTANIFRSRLDNRVPDSELFAGRGAYGEYFAHQAQTQSQTQSRHLI